MPNSTPSAETQIDKLIQDSEHLLADAIKIVVCRVSELSGIAPCVLMGDDHSTGLLEEALNLHAITAIKRGQLLASKVFLHMVTQ